MYIGQWTQGRYDGHGVELGEDAVCEGSFREGKKDGNATCTWPSGVIYSGYWEKGLKHGIGSELYPSDRLSGHWSYGVFLSGNYSSSDFFRASYLRNMKGLSNSQENDFLKEYTSLIVAQPLTIFDPTPLSEGIYYGQWNLEAQRHGNGFLSYFDGSVYFGNWTNGKKHGYGIMLYPDGTAYEGDWESDLYEGFGRFWMNASDLLDNYQPENPLIEVTRHPGMTEEFRKFSYIGTWKSGKKDGIGIEYDNRQFYQGYFSQGKKDSFGTLGIERRIQFSGIWKDNEKTNSGFHCIDGNPCYGQEKEDEINCFSFPEKVLTLSHGYLYAGKQYSGKVDALSFIVAERIYLIGVFIVTADEGGCTILRLEVIEGKATNGPVLYQHSMFEKCHSNEVLAKLIRFDKAIPIESSAIYTIQVSIIGRIENLVRTNPYRSSGEVSILLFTSEFGKGDEDNGTNDSQGVFSGFLYRKSC